MFFNTPVFLIFLVIVLLIYYWIDNRYRNGLLVLASYVFYLYQGAIFGLFLVLATLTSYLAALAMARMGAKSRGARGILSLSLSLFVGVLLFFKYHPTLFSLLGGNWQYRSILVPLGVSFLTFQIMGYMIDVCRGNMEAERNIIRHALFCSFFPVVVAGPIQRSSDLVPQFRQDHPFCYSTFVNGMQRFLTGAFKKTVMADGLYIFVGAVLNHDSVRDYTGLTLLLAVILYSFQLYFDFSGYSDMAAGVAGMLGFTIRENFRSPYLATNVTGVWKRWHTSLTTWLTDYVFTPLVWSRWWNKLFHGKKWQDHPPHFATNILIVFLLSGLWHGDTLHGGSPMIFLVWGALHAIYRLGEEALHAIFGKPKKATGIVRGIKTVGTFSLWSFSLLIFCSKTLDDVLYVVTHLFSNLSPRLLLNNVLYLFTEGIGDTGVYRLLIFGTLITGGVIMAIFDGMTYPGGSSLNPLAAISSRRRWLLYWFFGLSILFFFMISMTRLNGTPSFAYANF